MLYIVRHAWAEDAGEEYPDDKLRPLTKAGRKRFRKFVKQLAKRGFDPRHIATSPLVRCRETAEIIAANVPGEPQVAELEALAPGSSLEPLIDWTRRQTGADAAWVGHAPDVGMLAASLIGEPRLALHFAKGAVAAVEFDGEIAAGAGQLRWLITADILDC
ncbi:MAG TPA: histidine phosphatase family protein [Thermomicrobiales bacterium]|nr:histidine phosphatase family protein [Thermomicrobiales bacterium]